MSRQRRPPRQQDAGAIIFALLLTLLSLIVDPVGSRPPPDGDERNAIQRR